jgi:hypothetical protein
MMDFFEAQPRADWLEEEMRESPIEVHPIIH